MGLGLGCIETTASICSRAFTGGGVRLKVGVSVGWGRVGPAQARCNTAKGAIATVWKERGRECIRACVFVLGARGSHC